MQSNKSGEAIELTFWCCLFLQNWFICSLHRSISRWCSFTVAVHFINWSDIWSPTGYCGLHRLCPIFCVHLCEKEKMVKLQLQGDASFKESKALRDWIWWTITQEKEDYNRKMEFCCQPPASQVKTNYCLFRVGSSDTASVFFNQLFLFITQY